MNISKRKVMMFRCKQDPGIGPMPRLAYNIVDMQAFAEITQVGVYIRIPVRTKGNKSEFQEHIVPFENVSSIKLVPDESIEVSNGSASIEKTA